MEVFFAKFTKKVPNNGVFWNFLQDFAPPFAKETYRITRFCLLVVNLHSMYEFRHNKMKKTAVLAVLCSQTLEGTRTCGLSRVKGSDPNDRSL